MAHQQAYSIKAALAKPHFFSCPCSSGMRKNFFSDYLWESIIVFFVLLEIKVRLE